MTPVALNPNQRRHLEVVLEGLERALHQVEAAGIAEAGGSLAGVRHDLPPGFREAARPVVTRMLATIARVAADWGLQRSEYSERRAIRALMVAQMIRLEESGSAGLRGFGRVDPSIPETVEPELEALVQDLRDVLRLLGDRGTDRGT